MSFFLNDIFNYIISVIQVLKISECFQMSLNI